MTDINFTNPYFLSKKKIGNIKSDINPLFLREDELHKAMEMLFFAYRDFISEPDNILTKHSLGRAHHRVIYFVSRYPNMPVSDLLNILQITKQSLSRVLGQLVKDDYITQKKGIYDRRQRLLNLTEKGIILERKLTEDQRHRIERAFKAAGGDAVDGFYKVMSAIMSSPNDRARFKKHGNNK